MYILVTADGLLVYAVELVQYYPILPCLHHLFLKMLVLFSVEIKLEGQVVLST